MYQIKKTYEEYPCKNKIDGKHTKLADAIMELDCNQRLWRKHGGIIVSRKSKRLLVCRESDDSETITWTIEKI